MVREDDPYTNLFPDDEMDRQFMFKDAMDELMELTLQLQGDATSDVSPLSQDPKMWNVYASAFSLPLSTEYDGVNTTVGDWPEVAI